jgi:putative DeoR family transcriptional regulator (stage III sporulation protein D)
MCVDDKIISEAYYIIEHNATVRECARVFHTGKSTVHQDVTSRLMRINPSLYSRVREVLDINLAERHFRGGQATKQKYLNNKQES